MTLADVFKQMDKGRAEAEALRETRARNYAVKLGDGCRCTADGCSADMGLLVCDVGGGELTTRCARRHLEGRVMPGQWNERAEETT